MLCGMTTHKALLDVSELAALFRVTEGTIRIWVRAGKLQRVGFQRRILVRRADVEAMLGADLDDRGTAA